MDEEHIVEAASSAEEALSRLPDEYNLIISDIRLKKMMYGIGLLEAVSHAAQDPILMITGFGGAEIEEECRKKGAVGFLNKPFSVCINFSASWKRSARRPTDILNFTVMVKRGGR